MSHGDDNGLVLPPKLAPYQVVIIPIFKSEDELNEISEYIKPILNEIRNNGYSVKFDNRLNFKPGYKFNEHEIKGVPIRITVGQRDLEQKTLEIFRRDKMIKKNINFSEVNNEIEFLIVDIQNELLKKSQKFMNDNINIANNYQEFKKMIEEGGFVLAHWDGTTESEEKIKKETKATIRTIPFEKNNSGKCIISGRKSECRVYFARSY
jgi:prolyl-tRNA synthetase